MDSYVYPMRRLANVLFYTVMVGTFLFALLSSGDFSNRVQDGVIYVFLTEMFAFIISIVKQLNQKNHIVASLVPAFVGLFFFVIFGVLKNEIGPIVFYAVRCGVQLLSPPARNAKADNVVRLSALGGGAFLALLFKTGEGSDIGLIWAIIFYSILLFSQIGMMRTELR